MADLLDDPLAGVDVSDIIRRGRPDLKSIYASVAGNDPKQAAEVLGLAAKTGHPPAYVSANMPQVKSQVNTPSSDIFDEIERRHPVAAKFLADPNNMAVAHDDIPNVAAHDAMVSEVKTTRSILDALQAGYQASDTGLIARRKLPTLFVPENAPLSHKLAAQAGGLAGDFPFMVAGGIAGSPGGPIGAGAGTFALPAAIKEALVQHYQKGDIKSAYDLLERSFAVLKETGKQGAVGALTAGAGALAKPLGALAATGAEVATMTTAGKAVEGKLPNAEDFLETALVVGGMHGAGKTAELLHGNWIAAKKVEADQNFYKAMGATAEASKLRERLPEAHQALIRELTDGTPVENVHVPVQAWDRYFQGANIDPKQIAGELGVSKAYDEAKQTGNSVQVPLDTWVNKLVGTKHYEGLAGDVKFDQEGLSLNEMNERKDAQAEMLKQEQAKSDEAIKADVKAKAGHDFVREDVKRQLTEAKYLEGSKDQKKVIDASAKTAAAHYTAEATRRGLEVEDYYRQAAPKITGAGAAAEPESIEQSQAPGSPSGPAGGGQRPELPADEKAAKETLISEGPFRRAYPYQTSIEGKPFTVKTHADDLALHEALNNGGDPSDPAFRKDRAKIHHDEGHDHLAEVIKGKRAGEDVSASETKLKDSLYKMTLLLHGDAPDESTPDWVKKARAEAENEMPLEQAALDKTGTRKFKKWFGKSKTVDEEGKPMVLYHGTTGDFTTFDAERANPESDFGAGFYFTNAREDVSTNYAGEGPDLTNKIEHRSEQIADENGWEYNDKRAKEIARAEFSKHGGATMPVHLKMENPFVLGGDNETRLDIEYVENKDGDIVDEKGPLVDFISALRDEASKYNDGEVDDLISKLLENGSDGISASELYKIASETENFNYYTDDNGKLVSKEILRAAIEHAGFDGIEDHTPYQKFGPRQIKAPYGTPVSVPGMSGMDENTVHYIAFKPEQIKSAIGNSGKFDPNNPDILAQGERGFFDAKQKTIGLMKSADASTFLHESAHAWLESSFQHVKSGAADEAYLEHWDTAKKWLDIKDDQEKLTRDQQEKFAKGFEAYLREGNAPSPELRGVFSRFRNWLTQIYRSSRGLGEISNDVRGFMDRMLASEDEIARASQEVGYKPGEIADLPDGDPADQKKVRSLQERARQAAEEELLKEQMKELNEQQKKFLEDRRSEATRQASSELKDSPLYRASDDLIEGAPKGARTFDAAALANRFLAGQASDEEKANFETMAEYHNFKDGEDLAKQIAANPDFKSALAQKTEEKMLPYADLRNTEAIRQKALEAIHNTRSTELLALERQALERLTKQKEVGQEVTKIRRSIASWEARTAADQARDLLASKPIKEAGAFRPYFTAERNAALRVSQALAKGDYDAAAQAKKEQMLNHALAAEAIKNKAEIGRTLDYLDRFAKRGDSLLKMPYGFVRQIDELLAQRGLAEPRLNAQNEQARLKIAEDMSAKGLDASEIANATGYMIGSDGKWRREALPDFVARVNENYYAMQVPDSILGPQGPLKQASYYDMSMGELRDLKDTVKSINGIGRQFERFLNDFIKVDLKTAAQQLVDSIKAKLGAPRAGELAPGHEYDARWKEKLAGLKNLPEAYLNDQKTLLTLCDVLDAGDPNGPAKEFIYRPLKMAQDAKENRRIKYIDEINELMKQYYKPEDLAAMKKQSFKFDFMTDPNTGKPRTFYKDEIMAIARNWGNLGNRDRIMRGFKLDETQIGSIFQQTMDKRDWDSTQAIWDHLQTYWPDIVKLESKVRGVDPESVSPSPVQTPHGNYTGGYYPIAYDFDKSLDAYRYAQEKNALFKQYSSAAAHTDQGHTKARVNSLGRPVRLSADVLINHIENVNHDLAFREAVIDTNRFLRQPEVRGAIASALGQDGLKTIEDHLKAVASDQSDFVDGAEKALRWFRYKATLSTLGVRPAIFPLRLAGDITNSMAEMGPGGVWSAMKNYWGTADAREIVDSKSSLMKNRSETRERDIFDVSKSFEQGDSALKKTYIKYAFAADTYADQILTYPMWTQTYKDALAKFGDEQKAVNIADESIVRSFGSGRELDKIEAQRGSEWKRATTMFMSWNTMMFNRWLRATGIAQSQFFQQNAGAAAATLLKAATYTFILPAMYESVMREGMRNAVNSGGEFGDDDSKKRMLARALASPFGYMWIARDIAPVAIETAMGAGHREFKASPMEDSLQTLLNTAKGGEHLPENLAKAASYLTGYPQTINTYVFNFIDWLEKNGELTWRDFLSKRTKT